MTEGFRDFSYGSGLNELKYKCWKQELELCSCGKWTSTLLFIFSCEEINEKVLLTY